MDVQDKVGDEFVCPEALRGPLNSQQESVERIFRVSFTINTRNMPPGTSGQIWLRLQGSDRDVKAAKIFVKGLVSQEEQQEISYPVALNCIFCSANGFFMDCMIKSTSAQIVVSTPGLLLISGLTEPVVRAYSLIADLLERYKGGQAGSSDAEERGSGELCHSPQAFKALVEKWEDHHILDLLVLPRSVKEALLDLVKDSGLAPNMKRVGLHERSLPGMTLGVPGAAEEGQTEARRKAREKERTEQDEVEVETLSPANKEFWLLLKFFTAMGYTEDVVKRVLGRTGPKEASQILDLVQQEQDYSGGEHQSKRNPLYKMDDKTVGGGGDVPCEVGAVGSAQSKEEDDFVLGVLKRAVVSCGYTEHKVAKACSMLPHGASHLLLLELQKETGSEMKVLEEESPKAGMTKDVERIGSDTASQAEPGSNRHLNEVLVLPRPDPAKGPPGPMYASSFTHVPCLKPQSLSCSKGELQAQHSPTGSRECSNEASVPSMAVTGKQRFLEGLQTPFKLQLTDRPGNPKLRTVIIDGSNVAMSHGLGQFFSCRGIALAVQHFWERGHRHISALVPQWRQKSDPRIREQHYLGELENLGLLSFTPSREVMGTRISSYDDRLMLQLAQKTNGVIVTKDNMKDLLNESFAWRDIIKKRLLQYTFVGDHFMVPDDPLGRGGPHLDDFLHSDCRTSNPAGVPTHSASFNPQWSQIPAHNFPDQIPGGALNRTSEVSWEVELEHPKPRDKQGSETALASRTVEATASLRERLCQVFPGQDNMVMLVLQSNPTENDLNVLSALLLEQ
ncbi:NEDD4-binding protein 1 isoform X1 [Hippocampus zosterae]|uniref:NEDD4-binding protein 1 isoform X1 n=1 Tax=Hippocampus zosterae TaxID=109293 RepID=UPI00223E67C9|nr:NEDD4-binding protein 1 isoform X1 [Hippocampus zosterae]